jgi:hypothetical protein
LLLMAQRDRIQAVLVGVTMTRIELTSRVGPDGVLKFTVPVGPSEANREVKVTVESMPTNREEPLSDRDEWMQFIDDTAGKWEGEPLVRPDQGEFERRDQWA